MAKVVLLTDTHFGVRSNTLHDNMREFYDNVFFPYIKENVNKIAGFIHLGDVFHDRTKIDTLTLHKSREYFFEPMHQFLLETSNTMHIICGNHDTRFRDHLNTNSLREVIIGTSNTQNTFTIYTETTELPQWDMILVPWLTKNNREQTQQKIIQSQMKYALGHLELSGFNFSKTQVARVGDDPKNFSKFDKVLSGHYHYRHNRDNIYYLGSPTEQTWIDVNTTRGFHIFDTETGDLEFIKNPYNYFQNIKIGEEFKQDDHRKSYRLYLDGDEKQSEIDAFVKDLYQYNADKVDIHGANKKLTVQVSEEIDTDELVAEDTSTFIRGVIPEENIANIIIDLYNRAIMETE